MAPKDVETSIRQHLECVTSVSPFLILLKVNAYNQCILPTPFPFFQFIPSQPEQTRLTPRLSKQTVYFAKKFKQEAKRKAELEYACQQLVKACTWVEIDK